MSNVEKLKKKKSDDDALFTVMLSCPQVVNICVWVLASAFGVPAMVLGNVEEEQEHNSK